MTQKERIEQLEREVSDLRSLVASLQGQIAARPYVPYKPPPPYSPTVRPYPWPQGPTYGGCSIGTPHDPQLVVMS